MGAAVRIIALKAPLPSEPSSREQCTQCGTIVEVTPSDRRREQPKGEGYWLRRLCPRLGWDCPACEHFEVNPIYVEAPDVDP